MCSELCSILIYCVTSTLIVVVGEVHGLPSNHRWAAGGHLLGGLRRGEGQAGVRRPHGGARGTHRHGKVTLSSLLS